VTVRDPSIQIDAPDGSVRLYVPGRYTDPWQAMVLQSGDPTSTEVAWTEPRGRRGRYVCEVHGLQYVRTGCVHIRAALAARDVWNKERNR
jgi:hypothetical protein